MKSFFISFILFIPFVINISFKREINCFGYYLVSQAYEIILKINGTGTQNIISSLYTLCPNSVIHNNVNIKGNDCNKVDIPDNGNEINTLKLIWTEQNTNLAHIFY